MLWIGRLRIRCVLKGRREERERFASLALSIPTHNSPQTGTMSATSKERDAIFQVLRNQKANKVSPLSISRFPHHVVFPLITHLPLLVSVLSYE